MSYNNLRRSTEECGYQVAYRVLAAHKDYPAENRQAAAFDALIKGSDECPSVPSGLAKDIVRQAMYRLDRAVPVRTTHPATKAIPQAQPATA